MSLYVNPLKVLNKLNLFESILLTSVAFSFLWNILYDIQ